MSMKTFLNWLVSNRRISVHPLAHLKGGNVAVDRRWERRELADEKVRWLLATVQTSGVSYGLTGWQRYMLYSMAMGFDGDGNRLASFRVGQSDTAIVRPRIRSTNRSDSRKE